MLLTALWLLILAGVMGAAVMLSGLTAARQANTQAAAVAAELAAESALAEVEYDLLASGARSRWARDDATGTFTYGDVSVSVASSAEEGRLDVSAAEPKDIAVVLQALGADERTAQRIAGDIVELRTSGGQLVSVSQLAALPEMSERLWACLAPHVTIYTGFARPAPRYADAVLQRSLDLKPPEGSGGSATSDIGDAASIFRLSATAQNETDGSTTVVRVVRATGERLRPIWRQSAAPERNAAPCG